MVVGEILCDLFTPERGVLLAEAPVLVPHVGGAPANVAIALGWHGHQVEMVSALGGDALSSRMRRILQDHGVGLQHVETKEGELVGLLLIAVDADGERHFHPYREGTADLMMRPEDLPESLLRGAALVHAGTVTLREEPVRSTTRRAIALAREAEVPVSIDVNLRPKLFTDQGLMLELARDAARGADILKASRDEAVMMLGPGTIDRLVDDLHGMGARLVLLTDGEGPFVVSSGAARLVMRPPKVTAVDTTGAGDAFVGAALAHLLERGLGDPDRTGGDPLRWLSELDAESLEALGRFAAGNGARAVTALGATGGFPPRR
ncbi:MAG: carbohydrate kinase [Deltaproteobacteria bacterium]|nr:carbohydrate kinase [Deltaproteobacteria bacterium]